MDSRDEVMLTVVYTGEPDEVFGFASDGDSRTFGRDDRVCDIVIWSAINGTELSRMAGRIWRMDGELWVRNLSTQHELEVVIPGVPAETPLRTRRLDGFDPGAARSLPWDISYVRAPGGCELLVRQVGGSTLPLDFVEGDATTRVPEVPAALRAVAAALCEPLLAGGGLPATYSEIMRRTGGVSLKRTRTDVAELCALYTAESALLNERIRSRMRREQEALELPGELALRGGIWSLTMDEEAATTQPADVRRRRALALPDYFEVAHLLVRRRLITSADVEFLTRR